MVYFSMEEWDLLEEQKDLYKDVMMENQQLLSYVNLGKNNLLLSEMILNLTLSQPPMVSPDGSRKRNPPETCPRPLYSRNSTLEDHNYAHRFQGKDLIDLKVEVNVEQTFAKGDQSMEEVEMMVPPLEEEYFHVTMEDQPPLTSLDGSRKRNPPETCPGPLDSRDSTQDDHNYLPIPQHDQVDENETHKDFYKDVMMEPTHNRNPPEGCPHPLYSRDSTRDDHSYLPIPHHDQVDENETHKDLYKDVVMEPPEGCLCPRDSTQEDHNYAQRYQCEDLMGMKADDRTGEEEEVNVRRDQQSTEDTEKIITETEKESSQDISIDGTSKGNSPEKCPHTLDSKNSTHKDLTISHHDQGDGTEKRKDLSKEVMMGPPHNKNPPEKCPCPLDFKDLTILQGDEKHKDMMEPPHKRNSPEICPRPLYSWHSTLEDHNYAQHHPCEDLVGVKANNKPEEEDINVRGDQQSTEEAGMTATENKDESSLEITKDESSRRNTLERCPLPVDSQDATQEEHNYPHHDQDEKLNIGVKKEKEEMFVTGDRHFSDQVEMMDTDKEEELSLDISSDGRHAWNPSEGNLVLSADYKAEDDDLTQHSPGVNLIAHNRHHRPSHSVTSMAPCNPEESSEESRSRASYSPLVCHDMDRSQDPSNLSESSSSRKADVNGGHAWSCSVCGKGFTKHRTLLRHQRVHTGERPFSCTESGKRVTVKEALLTYQRIHSGGCPFSCAECSKCFSLKGELLRHQRVHTREEHFSCSDFGRCFTQKEKLDINQKIQIERRPFSCLECGKCFIQEEDMLKHNRVHAGELPFSCSECEKCFIEKRTLLIHHRSHTGEHPHSCLECGKSFTRNRTQRSHTGELPFSCSDCRKCFLQEDDLDRHQTVHTGERPFSCSKCGKRFSMKQSLLIHKTIHIGERPFPCSECGKCFAAKGKLLVHQRIHRGERPYSCLVCGKCFSMKQGLLIHQRVHTGEHPSLCSACGKCFTEKGSLLKRQGHHTRRGPFSCSACGKCFKQKENLIRHQSTHSC